MRKIKSPADLERIRRRNNILLGLVMIVLLTISTLGYSLMSSDSDSENVAEEGDFKFVRSDGLWKLAVGNEVFAFWNLPSEVSDVDVNLSVELGQYSGQPVYFVNPGEGAGEVLRNIGGYVLRYQEACLDPTNLTMQISGGCEGNLPIKNCDSNLIIFKEGNETKVYNERNCVFIFGDSMKGADAFLYKTLGIN